MASSKTEEYKDFCDELRQRTKQIHDKSDKLINLKLLVVLTNTKLWGKVLYDFYCVFSAIEGALWEHSSHPHVGPLVHKDMMRKSAFEIDLLYYLGPEWDQTKSSAAAQAYVDRINQVAAENPTLVVAYAHSMYLALLAGGQQIRRIVKKTLGLSGEEGLAIFTFENVDRKELRESFHKSVNELDLTRKEKEEIVAEKMKVFAMNNAIASNVKPTLGSYQRLAKFLVLILTALIVCLYVLKALPLWILGIVLLAVLLYLGQTFLFRV